MWSRLEALLKVFHILHNSAFLAAHIVVLVHVLIKVLFEAHCEVLSEIHLVLLAA